ncbi:MAG: TIGR02757 family protein [Verrucomicrobiota bacterium]
MKNRPSLAARKDLLEALYAKYNRPQLIAPDPLELLYRYRDPRDQEIAGLVAALLAYGGVRQIVGSASSVLGRMAPSPRRFIERTPAARLGGVFRVFRHRWTTGGDVAALLAGVKSALARYGSLEKSFLAGFSRDDDTVLPALAEWVKLLRGTRPAASRDLLSCPQRGSACKRLNLFLRWMVRQDDVDPGLWPGIPASRLVVPLDLHMHRIALAWGLTRRRSADLKAALEVTAAVRAVSPEDPVRYDFALTRASMAGAL